MSAINLDEVLNKLKNVRRNGHGYTALCPAHDDKRNSLSLKAGSNGRVLLHCFAGCPFYQIQAALRLGNHDINRHSFKSSQRIVAVYDYEDEAGKLLYQVIRYEPKGFSQRRPDGNGSFLYNLDGVRRVLYRLPEILKADPSQMVFICEGEKDADKLAADNLIVTTNNGGAGRWRDEYSPTLQGLRVVILPDSDEVGKRHAKRVAQSLYGKAESIRIVNLHDLPHKGDVSDWLESGGTIEQLLEMAENASFYEGEDSGRLSTFLSWDEFMSIQVSQDAPIAFTLKRGEVGLLSAVTNRGKSTLIRNALLALACGKEFQPIVERGEPRKVLLLDFETSLERLQPDLQGMSNAFAVDELRLIKENFFVTCERFIGDEPLSLSKHAYQVSQYAKAKRIDLIVVDTLSAAFDLKDENNNSEVTRSALKPLRELARRVNAALIVVHHIGKAGNEGANQSEKAYRARGASALGCHATAVFNLYGDKSDSKLLTLECAKRKDGGETFSKLMCLDSSRWFQLADNISTHKSPTNGELIIDVLRSSERALKRGEIVNTLKGKVAETTVDRWLKDAVTGGRIVKSQYGSYSLPELCHNEKAEEQESVGKQYACNI